MIFWLLAFISVVLWVACFCVWFRLVDHLWDAYVIPYIASKMGWDDDQARSHERID